MNYKFIDSSWSRVNSGLLAAKRVLMTVNGRRLDEYFKQKPIEVNLLWRNGMTFGKYSFQDLNNHQILVFYLQHQVKNGLTYRRE